MIDSDVHAEYCAIRVCSYERSKATVEKQCCSGSMMKLDRDLFFKALHIVWGSKLSRLGSTLAIIGALSLTSVVDQVLAALASEMGWSFNPPELPTWVSLVLVFIGVSASALNSYFERPRDLPGPNPNDVKLLAQFRGLVSNGFLTFLRDHDFGNIFSRSSVNCLSEISGWSGARFEFSDQSVQASFGKVATAARELDALIGEHTHPHKVQHHCQTVFADDYDGWNIPASTSQAIHALNSKATELSQFIDDFERVARDRIQAAP